MNETTEIEENEHEPNYSIDNDQLSLITENAATKLRRGEDSRREFIETLVALLMYEDEVVDKQGPLHSEGRMFFGKSRAGQEGVGLFLPGGLTETGNVEDTE